jgi:myo-inositol 2-dehydrogenase / D-chiro-inositol 1-dehydrogenase
MSASPSKNTVRVGVIGTGRIGRIHTTNLMRRIEGATVAAVADPFVDNAREWLDPLGVPEIHKDYKAVLGNPEVDAVYVCSSTDTHAQIVEEAAAAGKHIFCEKPIDLDVAKVRGALEKVERAGVTMMVGFNRRFDHNYAALQAAVAAGEVGQVHLVKITSRDPQPPPIDYVKVSGGLFLDMTIHDFDMARFLSGSEVTAVSAAGTVLVSNEIGAAGDIDTAVITLWFENGAIGVIDNSRQAVYGYDQRAEVFGSKGMVRTENDTETRVIRTTAEGPRSDKPLWFFLERYAEAYARESEAFVRALREGTTPPTTGADGLAPMLIGGAARKSLEEKRVVTIAEVS